MVGLDGVLAECVAVAEGDGYALTRTVAGERDRTEPDQLVAIDELQFVTSGEPTQNLSGDDQTGVYGVGVVDVSECQANGIEAGTATRDQLDVFENLDGLRILEDVVIVTVVFGQKVTPNLKEQCTMVIPFFVDLRQNLPQEIGTSKH